MLSKTSLLSRLINYTKSWQISTKLTIMYATIIALLLGFTCVATVVGMYFVIYHQAEMEMSFSIKNAMEKRNDPEFMAQADEEKLKDIPDEILLPGVVLRVEDSKGNIVYDNDRHFVPACPDRYTSTV